jgi:hypothetical protein
VAKQLPRETISTCGWVSVARVSGSVATEKLAVELELAEVLEYV